MIWDWVCAHWQLFAAPVLFVYSLFGVFFWMIYWPVKVQCGICSDRQWDISSILGVLHIFLAPAAVVWFVMTLVRITV